MGYDKLNQETQQEAPINYFSDQIFTDIKEKLKEKNTVFERKKFNCFFVCVRFNLSFGQIFNEIGPLTRMLGHFSRIRPLFLGRF